ncbi:D-amino-acid oxidase [Blastomyces parvus]|uniref:D-amino-acid oxidase n=1 Tax=Blastomyces parvus TaxID=2060905 RepID=A0A2B7WKR3_9EURO|nr:D-amino-acid oxidase [Blastomyces parvus]
MAPHQIVVVGAGVTGLTTALLLSRDASNQITVAAKHMPGDYDIEYCSPWAGANYLPVGLPGTAHAEWEKNTWPVLADLAKNDPSAGIHFQRTVINTRDKDEKSTTGQWFSELSRSDPWFKNVVPGFYLLTKEELGPGVDYATSFTSVCINTAVYLPWLVSQCLKNGVVFKRAVFKHIADAASVHHSGKKADLVVNCTGISSRKLGGVEDLKLQPSRGQIVVVRNDPGIMTSISGSDDGDDEVCYIMKRAAGGGTILGGTYQKGNWESQPDQSTAVRIMKRCVDLCPNLVGKDENGKQRGIEGLDIIRHGVGLRPLRDGGVRMEAETIGDVTVVHNYGHGGFGYQASWGCSAAAVEMIMEALGKKGKGMAKAKL